jgi:hypothetical protein
MKKALISLAAGSGLLVKPLANGIEMKTITSNNATQSRDGMASRKRQLLKLFASMEKSAQLVLIDVAEEWAEAFSRTSSQNQMAGGVV